MKITFYKVSTFQVVGTGIFIMMAYWACLAKGFDFTRLTPLHLAIGISFGLLHSIALKKLSIISLVANVPLMMAYYLCLKYSVSSLTPLHLVVGLLFGFLDSLGTAVIQLERKKENEKA